MYARGCKKLITFSNSNPLDYEKNHTPYLSVKAFFVNYAWIGVILILLSVIGQHENTSNNEYLSILYR